MISQFGPTTAKIVRELLITLFASLVLIAVAYMFIGKAKKVEATENTQYMVLIKGFWTDLDKDLAANYTQDSEGNMYFSGKNSLIDSIKVEASYTLKNQAVVDIMLKLKMLHWSLFEPTERDTSMATEGVSGSEGQKTGRNLDDIDNQYIIQKLAAETAESYKSLVPVSFSVDIMRLEYGNLKLPKHKLEPGDLKTDEFFSTCRVEEIITAYLKDNPIDSGSLASTGSTVGWKDYLEMLIFISLSVFILTSVVTLASRFIARLIAASFIQDMIRGTAIRSRIKTDLLPYFFSIPAFIWGTILAPSSLMQSEQVKFLAILLIIIVAGGLSFELILKYQEQSKLEYNKAYARYLSRYKRKREYLGVMQLIQMIFIPSRNHTLKNSQSVLPFILTGADYQLTDYTKRRMTVVVDAYALAGIVFSFTIWDNWGKPDLVLMLTETAGKYGFSLNVIVLIEAILVGILASKILMIISEHRQFPGER